MISTVYSLLPKILLFRLKQLWRVFKRVGFIRVFLLVFMAGFLLFKLPGFILGNGLLAVLAYPLIVLPIHLWRKDQGFLRKLDLSKEIILAGEYHALVLPFSLFLVFFQQWLAIFISHLFITLIIFLPDVNGKKRYWGNSRFIHWVPVYLFEWRGYLRQRKFFLLTLFVLTVLLSTYAVALSIGILLIVSTFSEAYNHLESKELIEAYHGSSNFLWSKVKDHSIFIHMLFLPVYGLFLLFNPGFWYILVLLITIIECSICFCLLYKYSWFGISASTIQNQVPFIIFFASTILFFPIGIAFLYFYWQKAIKALPAYAKD